MDSALSHTLQDHAAGLRRYALMLTRDPSQADDLVQECLKRALTYIDSGHEIMNLRAYLFTILNHVHIDELVRRRRKGHHVPIETVADTVTTPPDQIPRLECRDLWRALEELPDEQRQVLLLIGLEGASYRKAADAIGVPIGTVMSRLSRGRSTLRQMLSGQDGGHRTARDSVAGPPGRRDANRMALETAA